MYNLAHGRNFFPKILVIQAILYVASAKITIMSSELNNDDINHNTVMMMMMMMNMIIIIIIQ